MAGKGHRVVYISGEEAAAQVPGVEVGVVLGNGGMFASAATLVLANRLP